MNHTTQNTTQLNDTAVLGDTAAHYGAPAQPRVATDGPTQYAAHPGDQSLGQPLGQPAPHQAAYSTHAFPAAGDERSGDAFAITSFVLGIVSIIAGYLFIAPLLGLIFGILAKRRSTTARGLANWGVGINAVILGFWALIAAFFGSLALVAIAGGALWG